MYLTPGVISWMIILTFWSGLMIGWGIGLHVANRRWKKILKERETVTPSYEKGKVVLTAIKGGKDKKKNNPD